MSGTNITYAKAAEEAISMGLTTMQVVECMQLSNAYAGTKSYVNAPNSLTATLEDGVTVVTFTPINYQATYPKLSTTGVPEFTISIDGADADLINFINSSYASRTKTEISLRTYDASNTSAPMERGALTFVADTISLKQMQVQIKGSFANIKNKQAPSELYISERFPSLGS